jgi:hypothetical protein
MDDDDPFLGVPSQSHSPTSLGGAASVAARAPSQMRQSYDYILAHPGVSQEGVWLGLKLSTGQSFKERTIGARVVELHQAGLIEPCGEVTNTSGEQAEAYRVCAPFPSSGVVRRGPGALAQSQAEVARLRALCVTHGIDPDEGSHGGVSVVAPGDPFAYDDQDWV